MAIDASIYGQIQQPQIQDPLNALAKVAQVSSLQNQNRLADLAYSNAQRDQESQNALANAYKAAVDPTTGTVDRNKLFTGLAQAGQGAKVPALQEQFAKTDTALLAQQKAKIEQGLQHFEVVGRIMSGVKDQATYDTARQQAAQMFGPEAAANLPPVYDPATIARNQQQALSIKDQLEQKWKALDVDLKERQFGETVRNNRTQNSIAQGNLGVAQANLGLKRQELAQGKVPSGYRIASDGVSLEAIPGGPADLKAGGIPKLTEDQGKATGWLVQATNSFENMKAAIAGDPGAARPGVADAIASVPGLSAVGNHLRSPNRQKFNQASSSLSEALLRAATGAGVNKDEAVQKVQELTPVFGDSQDVIDQKMRAIPLYINSLKVRAGPGAPSAEKIVKGNRDATQPNIDALLDKYK
jgi:hypothetical protein